MRSEKGLSAGSVGLCVEGSDQERNERKRQRIERDHIEEERDYEREAAVEMLIEEARIEALREERREGFLSQKWRASVQSIVTEHLERLGPNLKVGQLGGLLNEVMNVIMMSDDSCRPLPKVGMRSLFPLPALDLHSAVSPDFSILHSMVKGLNSLHGVRAPPDFCGTPVGANAVKRLAEACGRNPLLSEEVPSLTFSDFFRHRGVSYEGEEVKLARKVVWESIEASLPDQVASLDIRNFCTDGTLEYINNFEKYMIPVDEQFLGPPPKMMIAEEDWERVAEGLISRGLCEVLGESELYHVKNKPVHNGMFSVSKQEFIGDLEICRLIMNLKPINSLCMSLTSDTGTLPSVTGMTGLYLQEDELLCLSSEDIRCFFYLFKVPRAWVRYLSFNKKVPARLIPVDVQNEAGYLCARVLPMGFINSVGIAQHIHRNVIRQSLGNFKRVLGAEAEIRRDRVQSQQDNLYRIYLDNFDELKKVSKGVADSLEGKISPLVEEVRAVYEEVGLPRHPKKAVSQQFRGEIQGAWFDGVTGIALAKPSKIVKYIRLGLELIREGKASQKELQIVGGGFVYIAMFKRPVLCGLNQIWSTITELDKKPPGKRVFLKKEVVLELARFIALMPLMYMDFRLPFDNALTASDASTTGGGFCITRGLTPYGVLASHGTVRGDRYEDPEAASVLSIGLFDGISALRVAMDTLQVPMAGHVSVELQPEARRVVEAFFPDSEFVEDVALVDAELVRKWALKYGSVVLVLIGSGPPCQGVSGLNADRRGALRDFRSKLFHHVPRITQLVKNEFCWAQVHNLTENVASMDSKDCETMNEEFEDTPWAIDAAGLSIARRPRVYWVSWDLEEEDHVTISKGAEHRLPIKGSVEFNCEVDESEFLESRWKRMVGQILPTFTTAGPSPHPLRKPAGLHLCQDHEVARWKDDDHRYPPYQYRDIHCVHKGGHSRPPSVLEREVILGFPPNYTKQCMSKQFHDRPQHVDCRLSLLGNSWSVPVICWLLKNLLGRLGIIEPISIGEVLRRLTPGQHSSLQGLLMRPPLKQGTSTAGSSPELVQKLFGLTSLKGEDLLVHGDSEPPLKYHRLRSSVPAKLWRWKAITGWQWKNRDEHINVLELRAVMTTLKWRIEQLEQTGLRCVHLVDSLVCLHSLSRGRSSSKKLRRTIMRVNSFLLASGLQPLWGYVDTKQNPADRPSRWAHSRKWVRKKPKC